MDKNKSNSNRSLTAEAVRFLRNLVVGQFVEREGTSPTPHTAVYRDFAAKFGHVPTYVVRSQVNSIKTNLGL